MSRTDIVILIIAMSALFYYLNIVAFGEALNPLHLKCPTETIFEINCPLCGLTRAGYCLRNIDFKGAAEHNKLSFIIFPTLISIQIYGLVTIFGYIKCIIKARNIIRNERNLPNK
jgi:hypothetical protein